MHRVERIDSLTLEFCAVRMLSVRRVPASSRRPTSVRSRSGRAESRERRRIAVGAFASRAPEAAPLREPGPARIEDGSEEIEDGSEQTERIGRDRTDRKRSNGSEETEREGSGRIEIGDRSAIDRYREGSGESRRTSPSEPGRRDK